MPDDRPRLEDDDEDIVLATAPVPTVPPPARSWEYRVEVVAVAEVLDADAFAQRLNMIAQEGWDLYGITDVGDRRALILRRTKTVARERRPVGFAPHAES